MPASPDPRALLGARLLLDTRLREAASVFLDALDARGIAAAPIKGLVTSVALYDDPLERSFGDVDVLVGRRDLARVIAVARERGFRIVHDSKQLFTLNVVIPPGIPMDVRASVGPPGFARVTAQALLARGRRVTDARVAAAPFWLLEGQDHLMLLMLDAVFDKFALRPQMRVAELSRALRRWGGAPAQLAERARAAGLATVAWMAVAWLCGETSDPVARGFLDALSPASKASGAVASRLLEAFRRAPSSPVARLGVRLAADSPIRGLAALALGAVGTAQFHARHRGMNPWEGVLWQQGASADDR